MTDFFDLRNSFCHSISPSLLRLTGEDQVGDRKKTGEIAEVLQNQGGLRREISQSLDEALRRTLSTTILVEWLKGVGSAASAAEGVCWAPIKSSGTGINS